MELPQDLKDYEADQPEVELINALGFLGGWCIVLVIVVVGLACS